MEDSNVPSSSSPGDEETLWRQAHRFSHQAMTTSFEILVLGREQKYAAQAATEAFALCNRLESLLSRYRPESDVSRLNQAAVNEPVLLSQETFACLLEAARLFEWSQGTFDVTLGRWSDKTPPPTTPSARSQLGITLDEEQWTAARRWADVQVDLGGIGKGFALDSMAAELKVWGVTQALLHGGGSTVLALEGPGPEQGWPVTVRHPITEDQVLAQVALQDQALAGSAQIERSHIVDPRTGQPVKDRLAAWALAPSGTLADGLSTAFMMMDPAAIAQLCKQEPGIVGIVIPRENEGREVKRWGRWPG